MIIRQNRQIIFAFSNNWKKLFYHVPLLFKFKTPKTSAPSRKKTSIPCLLFNQTLISFFCEGVCKFLYIMCRVPKAQRIMQITLEQSCLLIRSHIRVELSLKIRICSISFFKFYKIYTRFYVFISLILTTHPRFIFLYSQSTIICLLR